MITLDQIRDLYIDNDSSHSFDHVLRVTSLAIRIAEQEGADTEIVRLAALLHDIAAQSHRENHQLEGSLQAKQILAKGGYDPKTIQAVQHCIESHRFRKPENKPQTLEAKCLYDADKLDAIGAIGVARVFAFGGKHNQPLWGEVSKSYLEGKDTGESHSANHEYQVKLKKIRDRLLTDTGKQIAADRHNYMTSFVERLNQEISGAK
ncbi:MAG: HD domain-containing protein [Chloroflexota bacterium]